MRDTVKHSRKIATLNDELRRTFRGGQVVLTQGVSALDTYTQICALQLVRGYRDFSDVNNPYDERDFGGFQIGMHGFFWKIDCFDKGTAGLSFDPSNPKVTTRVLTIMLAEEY